MFVCSCAAVTDRRVDAAIEAGARTVEEIARDCRAGRHCGGCRPELLRRLAEAAAAATGSEPAPGSSSPVASSSHAAA